MKGDWESSGEGNGKSVLVIGGVLREESGKGGHRR